MKSGILKPLNTAAENALDRRRGDEKPGRFLNCPGFWHVGALIPRRSGVAQLASRAAAILIAGDRDASGFIEIRE